MRLVSIIVPVYNTKKEYLEKCILSLLSQTYKNIEIIVIDDGSEVECAKYCDDLKCKYMNIIVIHKKNGGVSSARNYGINIANGDYISFVDSDDWVENNFIEILVYEIENKNADMTIVNMMIENNGNNSINDIENNILNIQCINKNELLIKMLHSKSVGGFLCNKLFKRELIKEKLNEKLYYSEDFVFCAMYVENIDKAIYINQRLYHYRQGSSNATADFSYNNRIFSLLESYRILEKIYSRNIPKEIKYVKLNRLKIALNLRARYKYNKIKNNTQKKIILNIIWNYMSIVLSYKEIDITEKMNILLTFIFPTIMFRVKNLILKRKI